MPGPSSIPESASGEGVAVLRALLISDLVDSTALVERLGDERASLVFRRHDRLARDLLAQHGGLEIDKTDGFLLLFDRPLEAVLYALDYHKGLLQLSAELEAPLLARVGIHLGEVRLLRNEPEDVARGAKPIEVEGLAKPYTARLMSAALGGQTLLSQTAYDLGRRAAVGHAKAADLSWVSHGPYTLKGVEEPVDFFEVGLEGVSPLRPPEDSAKVKQVSGVSAGSFGSMGRAASDVDIVGSVIGGFRVVSRIGAGGMGVVYEAVDEALQRTIALKLLPAELTDDPERRARFLSEARSAAAVTHPNVATTYQVGEDAGRVYIAIEHLQGASLRRALKQGALELDEALRIAIAITRGVAQAHGAGVIHRDLKPENVMLTDDGQIKVLDFGLAKRVVSSSSVEEGSGVSVDGQIVGTPGYMSPEQARGLKVDPRTDIYAIGIILYEMISGSCPFDGKTPMDLVISVIRDDPEELDAPDAPAELRLVVERCLSKEPDDRYPDAKALLSDLEAVGALAAPAIDSGPMPELDPVTLRSRKPEARSVASGISRGYPAGRKKTGMGIVAGVVVLIAAVTGGVFFWPRGAPVEEVTVASPLAAPGSVLACPPLLASGAGEPSLWLGAAAADITCRRATAYLGADYDRALLPAQLIDAPMEVTEGIVRDVWDLEDTRSRAVEAAKTRAAAWVDGTVERRRRDFTATLVMRNPAGEELSRASGEGRYLHEALREAMNPLLANGMIPLAKTIRPEIARWVNTSDPETLAALLDFDMSLTLNLVHPNLSECDRIAKMAEKITYYEPYRAFCEETRNGSPRGVAPFAVDRSSPEAFAHTVGLARRYDRSLDIQSLEAEARTLYEAEEDPRGRAVLALAVISTSVTVDFSKSRLLAFGAVQEDPLHFWTWQLACGVSMRQKGGKIANRGFQTWTPGHPDAWNMATFNDPTEELSRKLVYGRRAVTLSPDYALFATNLARNLLQAGHVEEVRTLAARLATGGRRQKNGSEALLINVDMHEQRFGQALERSRTALSKIEIISLLEENDYELINNGLIVSRVLGREHETADAWAERFVLYEPPRLAAHGEYTTYMATNICAHASADVSKRCASRLRGLMDEGYFVAGHTALVPQLLEGLERHHAGDHAGMVKAWRPLGHRLRAGEMRTRLFLALGETELVERLDHENMENQQGEVGGVSFAHVREAERAAERGDTSKARELAQRVIKAWGSSDEEVPAVRQMQKLLARLR